MDEFIELSSYEYNRVIEAMMEQIQILRMELASVLCDVSRYLSEDEREEIRSTDPQDFINSLLKNEWYQLYVLNDPGELDPLSDQDYLEEVIDCLNDDDTDMFYPSFYSRKNLRDVQ